jgi:hypothetical protein
MAILTNALRCVVDSCAEQKPTCIHPCRDVTCGDNAFSESPISGIINYFRDLCVCYSMDNIIRDTDKHIYFVLKFQILVLFY